MTQRYVLALDQGTTSSRSILFDHAGNVVSVAQREFTQHYPQPGWVEHDAVEIWESQLAMAREALEMAGVATRAVAAIGRANQRGATAHSPTSGADRNDATSAATAKPAKNLEPSWWIGTKNAVIESTRV